VTKGDRVSLHTAHLLRLAIDAGLRPHGASARVVFGGFSAESLRDRINDPPAACWCPADGGYRRGNIVALRSGRRGRRHPSIEHVVARAVAPARRCRWR
jgi:acetyl-CoA synthetase